MEPKSRGVLAPGNVAQLFSMNKNVRIYLSITLTGRPFVARPVERLIRHIARENTDRHMTSSRYRLT
jgi:hypothetical protein